MLNFLKRLFSARSNVVALNADNVSDKERRKVMQAFSEKSGIAWFKGNIENGYSLKQVKDASHCPKCNAPTEVKYADFVYSTQKATRVMSAPAGHFCSRCPTVIVDEDLLRQGVTGNFVYQGVIGLDVKGDPRPFEYWNGKKPVFLIDEEKGGIRLITEDELHRMPGDDFSLPLATARSFKQEKKLARKKQMAKESRKRNRRK